MSEIRPRPTVSGSQARVVSRDPQPRKLLLALVLLLVALVGVVLQDRQFWFGTEPAALDSDQPGGAIASRSSANPAPRAANPESSTSARSKKRISAVPTSPEPSPSDAPVVATNRTVLPPLDVEVVAGDTHSKIHPGSNAAKVEITKQESDEPAAFAASTNAAERERMSTEAPQASYPLLAQHMNVRGSVILQAVIGADGIIQNLHVLSGPAILATAAQQAVREWHFKPILQNGQPVETKARITVNFTIKVGDNSGTTLAQSRPEDIQILSR